MDSGMITTFLYIAAFHSRVTQCVQMNLKHFLLTKIIPFTLISIEL